MNIENKIKDFKEKALKLMGLEEELDKLAEDIRSFFKHQNESTGSLSEDFIVTVVNRYSWEEAIEFLEELEAILKDEE